MSNEQLSMYLGPHHLLGQRARGQGGSKLKLAPLTHRSLPSLPSPCCHSPHSQLAGPHSQCPMNSLLCIGISTTSGGKGLGARWEQAEAGSPHSQITPLTPKSLLSLPSLPASWTSLQMSNEQLTMYWDLHHLWGQGARGQGGSKLKLAHLTSRSLPLLPPCSSLLPAHSQLAPAPSSLQLAPACSQLTPSSLQLAPSLLQLAPNGHVCVGVPTTCGV